MNRYSADLDFWFAKPTEQDLYFDRFKREVGDHYEITDAKMKHFTLLFELRKAAYPKRLKIEIRRQSDDLDYRISIAYSRFATKQISLHAITLEQTMINKVAAFLDRGEIRDGFDKIAIAQNSFIRSDAHVCRSHADNRRPSTR